MAEILVGGAFLSATFKVLFAKMASREALDFIRGRNVPVKLLNKLDASCLTIEAVLNDAEEKEITNPAVKKWLDELKDAFYDAEDLLDEIATEALRCQVEADYVTSTRKVQNSISTFFNRVGRKLKSKIEEVLDKLDHLVTEKNVIGLRENVEGKSSRRVPTTSLVEETRIYGRDNDKEPIVNMLLSNHEVASNNHPGVIPIVGMGGVGKTALVQLIYNDQRITAHFDLKVWVFVSQEFDNLGITETILKVVASDECDTKDFNILQTKLKKSLMGTKFLLVLDDVWNEKFDDWEDLMKPLKYGALGSKIIVTTRKESVASVMRTVPSYILNQLSEDDSWLLFTNYAFENGNSNAPQLEQIGRQIVKKCAGLPLATKTLGALLRRKPTIGEWDEVLRSEIWSLPNDGFNILPSLRLSYNYLTSDLKRCFAYFSIFPKNYKFTKNELILLWMAEGFLPQSDENTEMEDKGGEYFLHLVSSTLLQRSNDKNMCFSMHDLVHDLAKSVSRRFCFSLDGENMNKINTKTRHFSYLRSQHDTEKKFEALYKTKHLRTFLSLELHVVMDDMKIKKIPHDLLLSLRYLRVLSLSHHTKMTELPETIGDFKHLRYLDISYTKIKRLPESLCKLCNLQTLNLSECKFLGMLPSNIQKLINLRYLNITGTGIQKMPMQMVRLKSLRTLTKFIADTDSGFQIGKLGELSNLRGVIEISKLQNVVNPMDAWNAKLKAKRHLEELTLEWDAIDSVSDTISQSERVSRDVLNNLRPHTNLKRLVINNYNGTSFPNWVGDGSFSNITILHLVCCKNCSSLPSLGQLYSLQELYINGFDKVVTVGSDFYGRCSSTNTPFRSLEILEFKDMLKWEQWFPYDGEDEGGAFPRLQILSLWNCPKLSGSLPKLLHFLTILKIHECFELETDLPTAPAIRRLTLSYCNDVFLDKLPHTLQFLKMGGFKDFSFMPHEILPHQRCLEELVLGDCPMLERFPFDFYPSLKFLSILDCWQLQFPLCTCYPSLEALFIKQSCCFIPAFLLDITNLFRGHAVFPKLIKLVIKVCDSFISFPLDTFPKLIYLEIEKCSFTKLSVSVSEGRRPLVLESLIIEDCPNFVAFPSGGLPTPKLSHLELSNCLSLNSLPENIHTLEALQLLRISNCQVESFPEGGLPSNLEHLAIDVTEKSFGSRREWGLQRLHSLESIVLSNLAGDCRDESFPEEHLLPESITAVGIMGFNNLISLDKNGFHHLTSLEQLWIQFCPKLKHMPKDGVPISISYLHIDQCPSLTKKLRRKKGKEWRKISHIPTIEIDDEVIT